MEKFRIFFSVVSTPVWKWFAGGIVTIIGVIDLFIPDKITWLNQYLRQLLAGSRLKNRVNSAQTGDLLENLG